MTTRNRSYLLNVLAGLILLAGLTIAVSAETMICAYCRKPIESGKWFKIDGKTYHYNHFLCENCRQPIGDQSYVKKDGEYYDSTCFVKRFSRRCAVCDQPMMEWVTINGVDYHDSCYAEHVADRCAMCGKPILDGRYLYDDYGAKIHAEHMNEMMQCNYCSRLISSSSEGGERYPDGRIVCGFCLKSVVKDKDEADSLLEVARQLLAREGIVVDLRKLPLEVVSRRKMQSISPSHEQDMAGFTHIKQTKSLMGLIKDNDIKIYILEKMPRMNFIATAAHELMHVWLGLHDRFNTEEVLAEGSCNYASYLVLQRYPGESDHVVKHLLGETDPIYGEGFRQVKSYAQSVGTAGWLEYLTDYDFPPWTER